jgi:hypothetical protein
LAPIRWVQAACDCDLGRRSGGGGRESSYREAGGELEAKRNSSAAQQSLRDSARGRPTKRDWRGHGRIEDPMQLALQLTLEIAWAVHGK